MIRKTYHKDLFWQLAKYVITDAIRDQNVLRFGISMGNIKQERQHRYK
jgi:hypothetical protein